MSSYYGTKQLSDYSEGEIYSFWTQMLVVKEADERVIQKYGYLLLDDFSTSKELNALGRHRLKGVIVGKHESRHEKENDYIIVMFKNNDKYCIVEYAVGLEEDALWNDGSEKIEGNWVGHITPGTWNKPIDKGGLKSAREIVGGITKTDDIVGGITEAKVGVARKAKSSSIVGGITAVESKTEVVGGITAAKSKTEIVGGITAVKSTGDNEIVGGITAVKI